MYVIPQTTDTDQHAVSVVNESLSQTFTESLKRSYYLYFTIHFPIGATCTNWFMFYDDEMSMIANGV